ncbi:asparagine synthase (glutamine-hydrolysing) [Micromonospora pattaloongensis]|uniref:asparagine synthase (glutamine-hydrolyzing) n=1 Tax=Micromonospora pattaloongensis TaxID=405436 RepID=A0A1H3HH40_9ACTN|nr:asparagine synthase (glutamine-hydrolyzing) [Micromonospora pattaloongensis]SDY14782.1 asparagine synthase (glutamine-hydrolysing) [Micromonospora pattaloongensis]
MCGISGMVYDPNTRLVDPDRLLAMCRTLSHRGPDDEGMYVTGNAGLAMRRLAVVDVRSGRQPVRNEGKNIHAVFNGEIYNHVALRRELMRRGHRFESAADSEVIPHLYEEHGPDFPGRLEGMFAIAVFDEAAQRLVLCRDRIGIKPLYYASSPTGLVFGSEIRAILAAGVSVTLDPQALSNYLSLMYVPGPRSIYHEIRKLPPATTLIWENGVCRTRRYWDLARHEQRADLSRDAAERTLRQLVTDSVERHLMADVPLGFFMSGGIDSTSVVAAARRARPDGMLRTFTVGFPDRSYDERPEAALVARHLRTNHTDLAVEPRAEDVVNRIAPSFDEPFADPSMVPTYYLCQLAREHVTVALSGDGGDELFAGYHSYKADKLARYYRYLPRALTGRLAPELLRFMPTSHARASLDFRARRFVENALEDPARSHYLWRVVFREARKARLLRPDLYAEVVDAYETHEPHYLAGDRFDALTRFQYTDANVYLVEDVLAKMDRLSMAHSLEVRVPLLATPVAEFAFSLPGRLKMPGYRPKRLLRDAMADALPPKIATMRKKGFNAPLPRWLTGVFRPLVAEYLSRAVVERQGYLRFEEVDRLVTQHMERTAEHSRELWTLLMFSLWVEEHKAYR